MSHFGTLFQVIKLISYALNCNWNEFKYQRISKSDLQYCVLCLNLNDSKIVCELRATTMTEMAKQQQAEVPLLVVDQ